jgi:hypothetical protein
MRTGLPRASNAPRNASNRAATFSNLFLLPPAWPLRLYGASGPCKVMLHLGDRLRGAEVHVGRFPAHRIEQPRFVAILRQRSELDSRAVWRQTPHHPPAMETHTGIRHANRTLHEFVAINFRGRGFLGPNPCPRPNGLRFPGDERPRHLDKARIRGCPRLPSPAILLFNR